MRRSGRVGCTTQIQTRYFRYRFMSAVGLTPPPSEPGILGRSSAGSSTIRHTGGVGRTLRRCAARSRSSCEFREGTRFIHHRGKARIASGRGVRHSFPLPNDLASIVDGVFGLDNRRVAQRGGGGAPPGASPLTPPRVANLFNFPSLSAAGQTIGIIEFGGGWALGAGNKPIDIDAFFQGLGLATPGLTAVGIDGATNNFADSMQSDLEVVLDIDVAGAIAPKANIVVYFAPNTEQAGWMRSLPRSPRGPICPPYCQ
jgi:hypothetical protein